MNYNKQAKDFCKKYDVKITSKFLKHDKHFVDDKDSRDIYEVTIARKNKGSFTINFGQSIAKSLTPNKIDQLLSIVNIESLRESDKLLRLRQLNKLNIEYLASITISDYLFNLFKLVFNQSYCTVLHNKLRELLPSEYDILACLTKYDLIDFDNFCTDYGYSNDSIKASKVFEACNNEYCNVLKLFYDCIDELQEIN